jgi:hypothetical protein
VRTNGARIGGEIAATTGWRASVPRGPWEKVPLLWLAAWWLVVPWTHALEVDCQACDFCAGRPDLVGELTERVRQHLAAGRTAAQIAEREGGTALISSPIQEWANRHPSAVRPDLRKIKYRGSRLPSNPLFSAYVSCVRINGVCVGADKLGHLFQQGWEYYQIAVLDGKGEAVAERYGEWLEGTRPREYFAADEAYFHRQLSGGRMGYGGFGRSLSGVISHADLAANRAGLQFFKDLTAGRFKGMADYITTDLCEEIYRNGYTAEMRAIVEGNGRF